MRKLLPLLMLLAVACEAPPVQQEDLLERPVFTEALLRAQLIEARINQEVVVDQMPGGKAQQYYDEMFNELDITREEFERTFEYYTAHPMDLKDIYDDVVEELLRRKDQVGQ